MGTCITKYNPCQSNLEFKPINLNKNEICKLYDKNHNNKNRILYKYIDDFKNKLTDQYPKQKNYNFSSEVYFDNIIRILEIYQKNFLQNITKIQIYYKKYYSEKRTSSQCIFDKNKKEEKVDLDLDEPPKLISNIYGPDSIKKSEIEDYFKKKNMDLEFVDKFIQIFDTKRFSLCENKNKIFFENLEDVKAKNRDSYYNPNSLFQINKRNNSDKNFQAKSSINYSEKLGNFYLDIPVDPNFNFENNTRHKTSTISTSENNLINKSSSKEGFFGNQSHNYSNNSFSLGHKLKTDKPFSQNEKEKMINCKDFTKFLNPRENGKISFENGNFYIGGLENDRANFFGVFYNTNGDIFKGFWKDDKGEGFGLYKSPEYKLMGMWINNVLNGFGVYYIKKKKLYYEGEFLDGKKNGFGILLLNEGKYEGEFKGDKIEGIGSFHFKDERVYYGEWYDNQMHGKGLLIWKNGKKYEGEFRNNKKNGFGIFYSENKIYIGNWIDSKMDGTVIIYESGIFNKYIFRIGKKIKKNKFEECNQCFKKLEDLIEINKRI